MSKYHKIRWTEQDSKEIARVVKNFNSKINRLAKKNPSIASILPERVSSKQLKELINTRQDLHRELNALKRFSKKGAEQIIVIPDTEYDLKTTKWQKVEMNRRIGIINRRRKERLETLQKIEMKSRGKSLGYTRGQFGMGKATEVALQPMTPFFRTMGNTDLKKRWLSILIQSQSDYFTKRDYQLRDNFIKSIQENFNNSNVSDVILAIKKMDIKQFLTKFEEEGGTFEMNYPSKENEEKYENSLRSTWNPNNNDNKLWKKMNISGEEDLSLMKNLKFEFKIEYYDKKKINISFKNGQDAYEYIKDNNLEDKDFTLKRK